MTKRQTSIKIGQPMKLTLDQLRHLINNTIYEGDGTITVTNIDGGKKRVVVAGEGWSAACEVHSEFQLFPDTRYHGVITNMGNP